MQFIFFLALIFNPFSVNAAPVSSIDDCEPDAQCQKYISSYTWLSYLSLKQTEQDVETFTTAEVAHLSVSSQNLSSVNQTNVLLSSMTDALSRFTASGGAVEVFLHSSDGQFLWGVFFGLCLIAGLRSQPS